MKPRKCYQFLYAGKYCGGLKRALKSDLEKSKKRFEEHCAEQSAMDRETATRKFRITPDVDKIHFPEENNFIDVEKFLRVALEKQRLIDVVILRFGLLGYPEHTLEQTGRIFGVQRERIRQIEARALRRLRHWVCKCRKEFGYKYEEF